jgi:hypoxanthine-guanine phosphoribosyltransferase
MKLMSLSALQRVPAQPLGVAVCGGSVMFVGNLASKNKFSVRFEVLTEDLKLQQ